MLEKPADLFNEDSYFWHKPDKGNLEETSIDGQCNRLHELYNTFFLKGAVPLRQFPLLAFGQWCVVVPFAPILASTGRVAMV